MLKYQLGPEDGTLSVRTRRTGVAAIAGHDLLIHVDSWEATIELGGLMAVALEADGASLRVEDGSGGGAELTGEDKENIRRTIDAAVLKGEPVIFRSREVEPAGAGLHVIGDLTLNRQTKALSFDLKLTASGRIEGAAVVKQSNWGIKPYRGLFGALKVVDEVEVAIAAKLPQPQPA